MGKQWYWVVAGVAAGFALGTGVPIFIATMRPTPLPAALTPPSPDQAQRKAFIADCVEAVKGSIETPSTLSVIGNPRYVRHSRDGRFYLDVVLDYDAQNEFGASVRHNAFCSLSIDNIYEKINIQNILVNGITNYESSINKLKENIPEAHLVMPDMDTTELQYALEHGT